MKSSRFGFIGSTFPEVVFRVRGLMLPCKADILRLCC
jgi:hypothetical protein